MSGTSSSTAWKPFFYISNKHKSVFCYCYLTTAKNEVKQADHRTTTGFLFFSGIIFELKKIKSGRLDFTSKYLKFFSVE